MYSHLPTIASITCSPSSDTSSELPNIEEAVPELILMSSSMFLGNSLSSCCTCLAIVGISTVSFTGVVSGVWAVLQILHLQAARQTSQQSCFKSGVSSSKLSFCTFHQCFLKTCFEARFSSFKFYLFTTCT